MAERADVGPLGAHHAQGKFVRCGLLQQLQLVNGDGARLALHGLALPREIIELLPVDLERGVHRRELQKLAGKVLQRRAHLVRADGDRMRFQHRAGRILRVGDRAELQNGAVFLSPVFGKLHRLGRAAHKHGQDAGRHGVERSRVTDALFAQDAAQLGAHVHARPACRLVDNDDAVRHRLRLLCAKHSARLRRSSVSPQGGTLPQAEFTSAEDLKIRGAPRAVIDRVGRHTSMLVQPVGLSMMRMPSGIDCASFAPSIRRVCAVQAFRRKAELLFTPPPQPARRRGSPPSRRQGSRGTRSRRPRGVRRRRARRRPSSR